MDYLLSPEHQSIQAALYRSLEGANMGHAQLFTSPPGSIALHLILGLVTYMHCLQKDGHKACQQCSSCQKMSKFIHPDHHHLFPIGRMGSKEKTMTACLPFWRTFLREQPYANLQDWSEHIGNEAKQLQIHTEQVDYLRNVLSKKAFESSYKTILVWLPEHLNRVAANKMLKMVEEPTPNTYFFFVTHAPHHLLPTLRSRMWNMYIPGWSDHTLQAMLEAMHPETSRQQLAETIRIAQGNLNIAKKMLAGNHITYFEPVVEWLRSLYAKKLGQLVGIAELFHNYKPSIQKNWLLYAIQLLRTALLMPFSNAPTNFMQEEVTFCKKFQATVSLQDIQDIILSIDQLGRVLSRHANAKLAFMYTSFTIMQLLRSQAS